MNILSYCNKCLKNRSIVVLDAHHNAWDIIITAIFLRNELNPKIICMPVAGYVNYVPILKEVIKFVAKRWCINFIPVYRRDEYEPVNLLMKLLCNYYPTSLDGTARDMGNKYYIETTLALCKEPGNVIVVAPYGSPIWFGGKVKYGVRKLIESPAIKILSCSKWRFNVFKFVTHIGYYEQNLNHGYDRLMTREYN